MQKTAASALKWCLKSGGKVDSGDTVSRISKLGAEGRHKANIERDFHTLLKTISGRLGAKLSTARARTVVEQTLCYRKCGGYSGGLAMVFYIANWLQGLYTWCVCVLSSYCFRMYNHQAARVEWQDVPVLLPDELAKALYKRGESVFAHCMRGNVDAEKYWNHCRTHSTWFSNHTMRNYPRLDRLIPLSVYGDDVQCYKNSEIGTVSVIAWCSSFGFANKSMVRYFPICVFSEHCATEHTHEDLMQVIAGSISDMVDPEVIHDWSATGWAYVFNSVQGDLKWIRDNYFLFNFSANECCSLCGALKSHDDPGMTIADFRPNARHVGTLPDLTKFNATPPCLFTMLNVGPDRVEHDMMHGQLLGTTKVSNGSGIIYLAESSFWNRFQESGQYPDALQYTLQLAHKDFLQWKKQLGLNVTQPRFTPARLNRKGRQHYACLSCKASPSKAISMWIAERAVAHASREGASEMDKLVATCLRSFSLTVQLMDTAAEIFTEAEAESFYKHSLTHLQTFALLNKRSRALTGRQAIGKNLWLLMPKHHHLFHCALKARKDRINPRTGTLFAGEDFVGRISRIARVCHRSTVSLRVLMRYLALLHLHLERLKVWKKCIKHWGREGACNHCLFSENLSFPTMPVWETHGTSTCFEPNIPWRPLARYPFENPGNHGISRFGVDIPNWSLRTSDVSDPLGKINFSKREQHKWTRFPISLEMFGVL